MLLMVLSRNYLLLSKLGFRGYLRRLKVVTRKFLDIVAVVEARCAGVLFVRNRYALGYQVLVVPPIHLLVLIALVDVTLISELRYLMLLIILPLVKQLLHIL